MPRGLASRVLPVKIPCARTPPDSYPSERRCCNRSSKAQLLSWITPVPRYLRFSLLFRAGHDAFSFWSTLVMMRHAGHRLPTAVSKCIRPHSLVPLDGCSRVRSRASTVSVFQHILLAAVTPDFQLERHHWPVVGVCVGVVTSCSNTVV